MKTLNHILNTFFDLFKPKAKGYIILLNGTSTSGKSSLAQALAQSLRGKTEIFSLDQTSYEIIYQKFITERGYAPTSDEELNTYWDTVSEKALREHGHRDLADQEVDQQIYAKIRQSHLDGKNVIFDTVDKTFDCIRSLHELPVHLVLVYCPLEKLLMRIVQRNKSKDNSEHRRLSYPLDQFFEMYKKQTESAEIPVDILTKDQFDRFIAQIKIIGQQTERVKSELSEFIRTVDKKAPIISKDFGLDEQPSIEITPTFAYDIVVNTGLLTPEEAARHIQKCLECGIQCTALQKNYERLI